MNYIDSHSHLQNFMHSVEQVLDSARIGGCNIHVVNATNCDDWDRVLGLSNNITHKIIPFLGVHPWFVDNSCVLSQTLSLLERLLKIEHCGVGEIGLDKIKNKDCFEKQKQFFLAQLKLAVKYSKPVSIHSVKSHNEVIKNLKSLDLIPKFMLHSFVGSNNMVKQILDLGGLISLSFNILKVGKNKLKKLLDYVPMDRLLLESDSPDMRLPAYNILSDYFEQNELNALQLNSPSNMRLLYKIISKIKGIDQNLLVDNITMNFEEFIKDV